MSGVNAYASEEKRAFGTIPSVFGGFPYKDVGRPRAVITFCTASVPIPFFWLMSDFASSFI